MVHAVNQSRKWVGRLQSMGRRQRHVVIATHLLRLVWVAGVLMLALVAVDYCWPINGLVRTIIGLAVLVGMAVSVYRAIWHRACANSDAIRAAVQLERCYGLKHNPFINALQLAPRADVDHADLTSILAGRCIKLAQRVIESIDCRVIIPWNRLQRESLIFTVVCTTWIVLAVAQPLVLKGLSRWANPLIASPLHSRVTFEVTVSPQPVSFGDDVMVSARITGQKIERASLVELDGMQRPIRRWPMQRVQSDQVQRQLLSLRESMVYRVETETGRSHVFQITPVDAQRNTKTIQRRRSQVANGSNGSSARQARDASIALRMLADRAARLQKIAAESAPRLEHEAAMLAKDRLDQIAKQLAQYRDHHAKIRDQLQSVVDGDPRPWSQSFRVAASQLQQLQLPRLGTTTLDRRLPSLADGQQNTTTMKSVQQLNHWLARLQQAGVSDRENLIGSAAMLDRALAEVASIPDLEATSSVDAPVVRAGHDHEQIDLQPSRSEPIDAVVEQAPSTYRQIVAWYFQRLAQEQSVGHRGAEPNP